MKAAKGKEIADEKLTELRSEWSRAKGDDRKYLANIGKGLAQVIEGEKRKS